MTKPRWTPELYRADAIPEGERFTVEEESLGRMHYALEGRAVRMALQAGAERVTVVELDRDVIAHVAPYLDPRRVAVVQGDAFILRHPVGSRWSVVWHELCEDNLPLMTKLHRKFGGRCDWQGSWSREFLERRRPRW
ncbi:hypothetical protein LCGC14_0252370 [marine sediment metagenome]|uniref:Uncharacterized protein n=1 Tax=marine sediment metagenome TaxID=412755 RepID=A0A0F9U4K3_9ZZZZ